MGNGWCSARVRLRWSGMGCGMIQVMYRLLIRPSVGDVVQHCVGMGNTLCRQSAVKRCASLVVCVVGISDLVAAIVAAPTTCTSSAQRCNTKSLIIGDMCRCYCLHHQPPPLTTL
jgi:hypothetical protein